MSTNCTSREYEIRIEQIIVESDSGFYFIDSGSEYMGEHIDESDDEMSDTEQNINTRTRLSITDNETEIIWDDDVNEMFKFPFTKQNKLLVEVRNKKNPINFLFGFLTIVV